MNLGKKGQAKLAWLFLIPTLLFVFSVMLFPLGYNFWAAFHKVTIETIGENPPWIGLQNFSEALKGEFWGALFVNIVFPLGTATLSLILGLGGALLVNERFKGRGSLRSFFLFPYIVPVVSTAILWGILLDPGMGLVNSILQKTGLTHGTTCWLSESPVALFSLIFFTSWRYFPFMMLFILAALQTIPESLYDAAKIDRAGMWNRFRHVTLPSIKVPLAIIFFIRFLWEFCKYADPYLLTGGSGGTMNIPILIREQAFHMPLRFGLGAATAVILAIPLIFFTWIYLKKVVRI